nr:MAG TPA: hypothetical protein [Caudoviricetes sp.]
MQNSLAFIPLLRSSASHRKKRQKRPTDRIKKNSQTGRQRRVKEKAPFLPLARIKILSV